MINPLTPIHNELSLAQEQLTLAKACLEKAMKEFNVLSIQDWELPDEK